MTELQAIKSERASGGKAAVGRLFVLELSGGRIHTMNTDGSDRKTIVSDCRNCDGIVVDVEAGHIYWTNMGVPSLNDGSVERADIDGKNRKVIIPQGGTFTPKQIHLDKKSGKLYWCDREGMRVMGANLDGSKIETLVETGRGDADRHDQTKWCVGITIDPQREQIYWSQKGPDNAASPVQTPKYQGVKLRPIAPISKFCLTVCRSRLISSSMKEIASYIGPIEETLLVAIP